MAKHRMDVASFVGKLLEQDDVDALQEGVKMLAQALMEAEVSGPIGADLYERSSERVAHRNGYRTRTWDTRLGTIELKIPKITRGSYFPSLLEPRRRIEKALYAVVTEAYVKGISTRKVDDLVKALGIDGISKSEVSRICRGLDKDVQAFRNRPIEVETPYVWLDATYHKVRENVGGDNERVISVATVVAVGVTATGERTVVGGGLRTIRGPRLLDALSAGPRQARPQGRPARHLRRPRGSAPGSRKGAVGGFLAEMSNLSRPLHAQPVVSDPAATLRARWLRWCA